MRNIIINEKQEALLMNTILKESSDYVEELGPKRLRVKKFLDSQFKRGSSAIIDKEGNPNKMEVVVMVQGDKPLKTMDDKQLFYYVQSHFKDILPSDKRDDFLKKTIIAWYNKKINKNGNIIN